MERKEIWYVVEASDLNRDVMGVSHMFLVQTYPGQFAIEDQREQRELEEAAYQKGFEMSYIGDGLTHLLDRKTKRCINGCVLTQLRQLHPTVLGRRKNQERLEDLNDINVTIQVRMIKYGETKRN